MIIFKFNFRLSLTLSNHIVTPQEIIALKRNVEKENHIPLFRTLRWYFFLLAEYAICKRILGSSHLDEMVLRFGGKLMWTIFVKYHVSNVNYYVKKKYFLI